MSKIRYRFNTKTLSYEKAVTPIRTRIFRVISEAEPIPSDIRQAGFGNAYRYSALEGFNNSQLMISLTQKVDRLTKEMYIQSKSFDEVVKMAKGKEQLLASIPAIMPLSNKDLRHAPSGFGWRTHPIY